jgi:hypothetical protein
MRPLSSPHTRMTASGGRLSAMGHEQTWRHVRVTSAVPLKADIHQSGLHVRFVPTADILGVEDSFKAEHAKRSRPREAGSTVVSPSKSTFTFR